MSNDRIVILASEVHRGDGWGKYGTVRQVEELPDGRIDITSHPRWAGTGRCCRLRTRSRLPAGAHS